MIGPNIALSPSSPESNSNAGSSSGSDDDIVTGEASPGSGLFSLMPGWFFHSAAAAPTATQGAATSSTSSAYKSVLVNNGGMTFNLEFTLADNPTANFEDDVINAAKLLSAAISNQVTVNLVIGFGEVGGQTLSNGSAAAGPSSGNYKSYSSVVSALKSNATAGDTNFSSLPAGSSIDGNSNVVVWNAELKALGFTGASSADDGVAGFATDISDSLMVGVALHELTHALGRSPYGPGPDIFDLFRFSAAGTRVYDGSVPGPASYFSVDGGVTKLADYGQNSDPSDFANPNYGTPLSNLSPDDAFNQYYDSNTYQYLTSLDLTQLDVLGFNTVPAAAKKYVSYDFNGDGSADVLWRNSNGGIWAWDSNGSGGYASKAVGNPGTSYTVAGVGDFNGDAEADLLLRDNSSGATAIWDSNGSGGVTVKKLGTVGTSYTVAGVGDFNGDGSADILWRNSNGGLWLWGSNGSGGFTSKAVGNPGANYSVVGVGDFNGDGAADMLLRDNTSGATAIWEMNGSGVTVAKLGTPSTSFTVAGVGDFNHDGKADILWRNSNGGLWIWSSNGSGGFTSAGVGNPGTSVTVQGVSDFNGDGYADILLRSDTGAVSLWTNNQAGGFTHAAVATLASSWSIQGG